MHVSAPNRSLSRILLTASLTLMAGCLAAEPRISDDNDDLEQGEPHAEVQAALSSNCSNCAQLPATQEIADPQFLPEGLEVDPLRGELLVGSMKHGGVYRVRNQQTLPFGKHSEQNFWNQNQLGSVGIHVDQAHQRLLVTATRRDILQGVRPGFVDPTLAGKPGIQAGLAVYDLRTQKRLFFADFTAIRPGTIAMVNDVTVDAAGNAYVTDSVGGAIYKVTPRGTATLFAQSPLFSNPVFGPNGIDFDPSGYLIVAVSGTASLARVSVANPTQVTAVSWQMPFIVDGLTRAPDGRWIAVGAQPAFDANGNPDLPHFVPAVLELTSADLWQSAVVTKKALLNKPGTTAAVCGSEVYVSLLNTFDPQPMPTELRRVTFP